MDNPFFLGCRFASPKALRLGPAQPENSYDPPPFRLFSILSPAILISPLLLKIFGSKFVVVPSSWFFFLFLTFLDPFELPLSLP